MYKFVEIQTDDYINYNEFIANHIYGNIRQTTIWGDIKKESGWIVKYYCLKKNANIVGIATIFKKKVPLLPLALLYCCNGPVVSWEDRELCEKFLRFFKSILKIEKGICLRIDPEPSENILNQENILINNGVKKINDRVTKWNRSLYTTRILLEQDEDKLFAQFRKTLRQNIKKTIKSGVQVTIQTDSGDKNALFRLMEGLEVKRDSLIHEKKYYDKIYDNAVSYNHGFFIKAIFNGKVISGILMSILGKKAYALFISNDYEYRQLMPNKLLVWESIKLAKKMGCEYIDLGATQGKAKFDPENDPLDLFKNAFRPSIITFPGYYDFKGKFYGVFRVMEKYIFSIIIKYYYRFKRTQRLKNQG